MHSPRSGGSRCSLPGRVLLRQGSTQHNASSRTERRRHLSARILLSNRIESTPVVRLGNVRRCIWSRERNRLHTMHSGNVLRGAEPDQSQWFMRTRLLLSNWIITLRPGCVPGRKLLSHRKLHSHPVSSGNLLEHNSAFFICGVRLL